MSLQLFGQARLTRDPELRYTPKGTAVCQFGIATNRKSKDAAGNEREETYFGDVEAWGKTGELVAQYFRKGAAIIISRARLKTESWEDKATKEKKSKTRIVLEEFEFPAVKPKEAGSEVAPKAQIRTESTTPSIEAMDKNDVPF